MKRESQFAFDAVAIAGDLLVNQMLEDMKKCDKYPSCDICLCNHRYRGLPLCFIISSALSQTRKQKRKKIKKSKGKV